MIAIALFFLWMVFNGKLTLELVIIGAAISILLAWFVQVFVSPGFTLKKQLVMAKQFPGYVSFAWLLVIEIILANFAVMRMILTDRDIVVPKLANFKTKLKTTPARVILADCITLTPGTITVQLKDDEYLVHCLDESLESGLVDSAFEKRMLIKEEKWEKSVSE